MFLIFLQNQNFSLSLLFCHSFSVNCFQQPLWLCTKGYTKQPALFHECFWRRVALFSVTRLMAPLWFYRLRRAVFSHIVCISIFLQPWFCPAALAANAAAFGRSLRWVFQGFPTSEKKGAKECKSCRSRKTLQNEYLVAKIGVDTAENEPSKVSRKWGFQSASFRGHYERHKAKRDA